MTDKEFSLRLAKLRTQKGVSARDMSLSMGQNPGYINNIETGKSMPSLSGFFYICDYLDITARDFFDDGNEYPEQLRAVFQDMQKLSPEQLQNIHAIVKGLLRWAHAILSPIQPRDHEIRTAMLTLLFARTAHLCATGGLLCKIRPVHEIDSVIAERNRTLAWRCTPTNK